MQAHRIVPARDRYWLELNEANLLLLCMGPYECHYRIGHGGDWRRRNPYAAVDAEIVRVNPELRQEYEAKARALAT